jgi:predicted Rossmann-fold nucleotide-binding protein
MSKENPLVGSAVKASAFAKEKASASLRVCCFGSSSSETPAAYLRPSAEVGYLLAVRGHVCVNGAGSFGCMAAMNEGAVLGNGHIVGVIHEMWLVDGPEDTRRQQWGLQRPLRDSGAHAAFSSTQKGGDSPLALSSGGSPEGPIRELLVAGGKDLQERKKLLVEKADGLIVMPGGPGTFDEVRQIVKVLDIV